MSDEHGAMFTYLERLQPESLYCVLIEGGSQDKVWRGTTLFAHLGNHTQTVEPRHLDVQEDHREVVLEQRLQRLFAGRRGRNAAVQRGEHGLHRNEVVVAVVDQQDLRLQTLCSHTRISAVSWSMSTGLVM